MKLMKENNESMFYKEKNNNDLDSQWEDITTK